VIPFCMHGCISYFALHLPTQTEINDCWQIVFMSEQEWDPYSQTFATLEKVYEKKEHGPTEGKCCTHTGSNSCINISTTSSHNWHSTIDATTLAHQWGTSIETASHTLTLTMTCMLGSTQWKSSVNAFVQDKVSFAFPTFEQTGIWVPWSCQLFPSMDISMASYFVMMKIG